MDLELPHDGAAGGDARTWHQVPVPCGPHDAEVLLAATAVLAYRYTDETLVRVGIAFGSAPGVVAVVDLDGAVTPNHAVDRARAALGAASPGPIPEIGIRSEPGGAAGSCGRELELCIVAGGCELAGRSDAFALHSVARIATQLARALDGFVTSPEAPISAVPLLDEPERQRLLQAGDHQTDYPEETLTGLFRAQVRVAPESIAIDAGHTKVTYAQLAARAVHFGNSVQRLDAAPGSTVAVLLRNGPEQVAALLGVLVAGRAFVCLDPEYPEVRLGQVLDDVRPGVVLTDTASASQHQSLLAAAAAVGARVAMADSPESPSVEGSEWQGVDSRPSDRCYVVYTSGSTGRPKGIVQTHRAFCQFLSWQAREIGIGPGTRFAQWASTAYDASYCEIFGTLCFGGTLVMAGPEVRHDPAAIGPWVRDAAVTVLQVVPSFCRLVLAALDKAERLPSLRAWMLAGEVLPPDLASAVRDRFPHAALYNLYGPSECVLATFHKVEERPSGRRVPVGRAIDGRAIVVLDTGGQPSPVGVRGEICVRSRYLTDGYLNRPDETSRVFVQSPAHDDFPDPVYRTGDRGRLLADGTLDFLGRLDTQVKVRGIRIELADVETALRRHPGVIDCAVVVRAAALGRGTLIAKEREAHLAARGAPRLVAYYTAANGLSPSALRRFLEVQVPAHMVPHHLVPLPSLPLNANRKLDVAALPEPEGIRPDLATPFTPPRGAEEEQVAQVFEEVLGVHGIGRHDPFFDLGGDSLLAMQALNRIRARTGAELPFRGLFDGGTVATVASLVRSSNPAPRPRTLRDADAPGAEHPLTSAQAGIWFLWRLDPESPYYTAQGVIHLRGPLDLTRLELAWRTVEARHEVLRARFGERDGKPFQVFEPDRQAPFAVRDVSGLEPGARDEAIAATATAQVRPLNLKDDPLVHLDAFVLSPDSSDVLLTFHEIALDLWGISVVLGDLAAVLAGRPLPELAASFGEVVRGEAAREAGAAAAEAYWREALAGDLPVIALPADHPRPVRPTYRGAATSAALDEDVSAALAELAASRHATLFATLLAGFAVLLRAYSGDAEVIVGAPIANRRTHDAEEVAGFFLNMLPLRVRPDPFEPFGDLVTRTAAVVADAITYGDFPFTRMVESADVARDGSTSPVFQVMFNMLNLPHTYASTGDVEITFSERDTGYNKYDLALYAQSHGPRIHLQLAYLTDLFDHPTAARMLDNLVALFAAVAAAPDTTIGDLPAFSPSERQTLERFAGRDAPVPRTTLPALFEAQAAATPGAVALRCAGEALSFTTVRARASALTAALREAGVASGDVVAVCAERSFATVIGPLGVLHAGAAYVALDPDHPGAALRRILADARPTALVLAGGSTRIAGFGGPHITLGLDGTLAVPPRASEPTPATPADPRATCAVVYTSGSTGAPKGARIPTAAVVNRLQWMWDAYPFAPGEVAVLHKSAALVASNWEMFGALLRGVPTVILTRDEVGDPGLFLARLRGEGVTRLLASPPVLTALLEEVEAHPGVWPQAALVTSSAEPLTPELARRWRRAFPTATLLNLYGVTECASNVAAYDTSAMPADARRVPVGKPLPNTRVYVLDDELALVPLGAEGEMCVSGACLADGYVGDATGEARFVRNPHGTGDYARLYRTGDSARWRPDGSLDLVGRRDQQLKVRGFRVEPGAVERVLSTHPAVVDVAVGGKPTPAGTRLVACVVPSAAVTSHELRTHVRAQLPEYMVPVDVVCLDRLPLTSTGKLDLRAVPQAVASANTAAAFVAPRNEHEEAVAAMWRELLGRDRVGVHDDFFELGGHSLLAMQVVSRIRARLGVELPVRRLYDTPTVADVAAAISGTDGWEEGDL